MRALIVVDVQNEFSARDVRYQRSHAMVAQPARMNSRRNERTAKSVHFYERRQISGISKVVSEFSLGEVRTSGGFGSDNARRASILDLAAPAHGWGDSIPGRSILPAGSK
jgi:hypothetical protein